MTATDTLPAADTGPNSKWAKIVLGVFVLYVAALYVLALNETLGWGLFPSTLEKQLSAQVAQLGDSKLSLEQKDALAEEIVSWGSFAVLPLITGIEQGSDEEKKNALLCLQALAKKYYNVDLATVGPEPKKLRQWWSEMQAQWEKAEKKPSAP